MIESYDFGKIVIHGKSYRNDIIIFSNKIQDTWWRKKGHELQTADVDEILNKEIPEVLIIGTGKYGVMEVPNVTEKYVNAKGVELIAKKTDGACAEYNRLSKTKKVIGAFHLTC